MVSSDKTSIYAKVVRVTHVYLGPAAERFIDRQVENHLHKPPDMVTRTDIISLIDWIRVVVSLLTDDEEMIEEYLAELKKIANPENKQTKRV